jgi:hypothetical protein
VGHCELFAGGFVLLARDAGYPARMVVGFVGGSWNAVEDFFVVRNSDAHAWVEIYDAQAQEWLRVDPTPGASSNDPEMRMPTKFEFETGMSAWVDSLRIQWYRRIVNFEQQDQVELATSMVDLGDALIDSLRARFNLLKASLKAWLHSPWDSASLILMTFLGALCLCLFAGWRTRGRWLYRLLGLFRSKSGLNPVRREAARYLVQVRAHIEQSDADAPYLEGLRTIRGELEALRFGLNVSTSVAQQVFIEAKQVLKRSRKKL